MKHIIQSGRARANVIAIVAAALLILVAYFAGQNNFFSGGASIKTSGDQVGAANNSDLAAPVYFVPLKVTAASAADLTGTILTNTKLLLPLADTPLAGQSSLKVVYGSKSIINLTTLDTDPTLISKIAEFNRAVSAGEDVSSMTPPNPIANQTPKTPADVKVGDTVVAGVRWAADGQRLIETLDIITNPTLL